MKRVEGVRQSLAWQRCNVLETTWQKQHMTYTTMMVIRKPARIRNIPIVLR